MKKNTANQENSQKLFKLMPGLMTEFWWVAWQPMPVEPEPVRYKSDPYRIGNVICPAPLADELAELLPEYIYIDKSNRNNPY